MEDSKIIQLFFDRDEQAIAETQTKYDGYLRTVSRNILQRSEDVEECVNDTYLGAWNAIPPTRPNVLRVFLGKITRNLSLKKIRFESAEKRGGGEVDLTLDELAECISDGRRIEENLEARELGDLISEYLSGKSPEDRKIFVRRYWYFDSVKDIAESLNFTESKVKMSLKRCRDELKDYLEARGVAV